MEQSFADLLGDAFSETTVPSFPDGDLDFESLNFDEKLEEDKGGISHENLATKEDEALHQEATDQTALLSHMETKDLYMAESVDKEESDEEDFQGAGVIMSMDKILEEEDYTSSDGDSEQEGSVSGEDEEDEEEDMGTGEKPGELLMSVRCGDEFCDDDKEDRIFAEGQPLAPEGAKNPQVRNEDQGGSESDEDVSYFERVPERGSEMMIKGDRCEDEQEREEEKQEDSSGSEQEGMKIEQEENVLALCFQQDVDNPCTDGPARAHLEFTEISGQNLQDLVAEVDSEEYVEKMEDFSGEEHQEAGESFADYPSDFSSCEYLEDGGKNQNSNHQSIATQDACLEGAGTDITWMERAEDAEEEGDEYLYSIDLEVDVGKFRSPDVASGGEGRGKIELVEHVLGDAAVTQCDDGGEVGESDSYSSSDNEVQVKNSDEELLENTNPQDLENNKQPEELHGGSSAVFSRWSTSDDCNRDPADFNIDWNLDVLTNDVLLSEDLLTTEDTDKAETPPSHVTLTEDNSYSVVQRGGAKTKGTSNQGSLDDSFFFNTELEASGISELGQLGDDEYEGERNWEQEQERIKAFYEFYDDSDGENGREGRQIKVQFCTDPLSQVLHYETESDRESFSSSTDGEDDLSAGETSEVSMWTRTEPREPNDTTQMKPACDPPNTRLPENLPDFSNTQICTRKHKCLNMLKLTVKMGVAIMMGLLMFWLATDQASWLSQMLFF
ncbi:deoxyribonuclease I-like 1-like isoform X2 [Chelmon rostratus]|uniref:deoxyribonuclease I-like 1-like isoform X2 n=1 Tax=Chelmon rostratus TaxID=109905 RepID=UPI001BE63272|nr:deoxyribonuclease I-like 1-like isoform X2 [Chelmon rostratus]